MKSKFMAITIVLALVLSLVLALAGPVAAFPVYNVSGTWNVNLEYLSVNYPESLVLTQTGGNITGVSLDSIPPVFASAFTITGGSVSGNTIVLHASYNPNNLKTVIFNGTIANSGSMSGTWADDPGFLDRTGTWSATKAPDTVNVTGNVLAATVSLDYQTPATIPLGMFVVGRNPAGTAWTDTGTPFGTVTIVNNSDPNPTWTLTATSINDGLKDFSGGRMYCDALGRYLDDALYVSLDGGTTAAQLPGGVSTTGHASYNFRLSTAQIVSQNDVNYGIGDYYMIVQLNASIAP